MFRVRNALRAVLAPELRLRDLVAQATRYVIATGTTTLLYVGLTLGLSGLSGAPIQIAIPIAYVTAVVINFILQRRFVFPHGEEFALPVYHQARYFVLVGLFIVGFSIAATTVLPPLLGISEQVAYLGTVVVTPLVTFTVLRTWVFHRSR